MSKGSAAGAAPLVAGHTPGPWSISAGRTLEHIVGSDGHGICAVSTTPISKDAPAHERIAYRVRALADARLIAAAPEMLEALKAIRHWLLDTKLIERDDIWNRDFVKANNLANSAIAKATGATP